MNYKIQHYICIIIAITMTSLSYGGDGHKKGDGKSHHGHRSNAHSREAFMLKYDSNEDGVVSKEEFDAVRKTSYQDKDMNGDGVITADEYVAEWQVRLEKQLEQQRKSSIEQAYVRYGVLDSDENNDMTLEEFNASGNKTFSRYQTSLEGSKSEPEKGKNKSCSSTSGESDSEKSCCCKG